VKKILFLILIISINNYVQAATISPASLCLEEFDIGLNVDLGIDFVISNVHNVGPVKLSTQIPEIEKILKGYSPIPDNSWLYFLNYQIVPDKNGFARARMFLKVPNDEKYLNQHWCVYVSAYPPKMGFLIPKLVAIYMIETKADSNVNKKPFGELGVVPSRIELENVIPEKKRQASFRIYNNDKTSHTYKLSVQTFDPSFYQKLQISNAPGYEWVKYTNWVKLEKDIVELQSGKTKDIKLNVRIPTKIQPEDDGFEAVVMVESITNKNIANFTRVLIKPEIKD